MNHYLPQTYPACCSPVVSSCNMNFLWGKASGRPPTWKTRPPTWKTHLLWLSHHRKPKITRFPNRKWVKKLWMKNEEGSWENELKHLGGFRNKSSQRTQETNLLRRTNKRPVWWIRHVARKCKLLLSSATSIRSEFDLLPVCSQELLTNELIQSGWIDDKGTQKQKLHQLPYVVLKGSTSIVKTVGKLGSPYPSAWKTGWRISLTTLSLVNNRDLSE